MTLFSNIDVSLFAHVISQVPIIGLIGSGGGPRATIGYLGAFQGLQKLGVLDTAMYSSVISGSSWLVYLKCSC